MRVASGVRTVLRVADDATRCTHLRWALDHCSVGEEVVAMRVRRPPHHPTKPHAPHVVGPRSAQLHHSLLVALVPRARGTRLLERCLPAPVAEPSARADDDAECRRTTRRLLRLAPRSALGWFQAHHKTTNHVHLVVALRRAADEPRLMRDPSAAASFLLSFLRVRLDKSAGLFDTQGLANAACSLGRMRTNARPPHTNQADRNSHGPGLCQQVDECLHALLLATVPRLYQFAPGHLSNVAWGFTAAVEGGWRAEEGQLARLTTHIARAATQCLPREGEAWATDGSHFAPNEVAMLARAFGKLHPYPRHHTIRFLRDVSAVVGALLPAFPAQHLANLAWAFATVGLRLPPLFDAIAAQAAHRAPQFKAQEWSVLAWSFATLGIGNPALFALVEECVVAKPTSQFTPQGIANLTWALAKTHHRPLPSGVAWLADAVRDNAAAMRSMEVSMSVWGLASLGVLHTGRGERAKAALASRAVGSAHHFATKQVAIVLFALTHTRDAQGRWVERECEGDAERDVLRRLSEVGAGKLQAGGDCSHHVDHNTISRVFGACSPHHEAVTALLGSLKK